MENLNQLMEAHVPVVMLNGVEIYYEVHGEGEPLMLVAGLGSDSQSWAGALQDLADSFQVIVLDNRGVGRTSQDVSITIEAMARDCVALLDHLSIPSAHILGHSMGGFIALEMGVTSPERIRKLVLAGTASTFPSEERDLLREWDKRFESDDLAVWLEYIFQWIFTRKFLANPLKLAATITYSVEYPYPQEKEAFHRQTEALFDYDCSSRLARIASPALVLCGAEDILISPQLSKESLSAIPDASFVILAGAAHAIHLEDQAGFVAAVRDFLVGGQTKA